MKILNLKIINPSLEVIRDIPFKENGVSIIYGKIEQPKAKKKTSNSIGKTVLLKFVCYIFGRQEKKKDFPKVIQGWILKAEVLHKSSKYIVEKTIGESNNLKINDKTYKYKEYLKFFDIDRGIYSKQIFLKRRTNILSQVNPNPTTDDVENFLSLVGLNSIINLFLETRNYQDKLKTYNKYNSLFKEDIEKLKSNEYILSRKKEKIEAEISLLSKRIEKLNISDDSYKLIELHTLKNAELKSIEIEYEQNKGKVRKLNELIVEANKIDITHNDIYKLYENANYAVPDMVKKTLKDVEKFYQDMFSDKEETYKKTITNINNDNDKLKIKIDELRLEVEKLADNVSTSNVFQESMQIYETKRNELSTILNEYGKVVGAIDEFNKKNELVEIINEKYNLLEAFLPKFESLINEYKKYVYDLVGEIYGDERGAFFDISMTTSKKKVESMPLSIKVTINGDDGEGIEAVKNVVIDLLIFKYNNFIEFLIHDSSCFEGIDKRQLTSLIKITRDLAMEKHKQYIFSINEYHLEKDDEEFVDFIFSNKCITLSEDDKLLKIKF